MDMLVGINEMSRNNRGEQLGRGDRVLLCHDVDGLLHGVSSYHHAVIGFGVADSGPLAAGYIAFQHELDAYEVSISPFNSTHTVISTTSWTPVFSSLWTL